MDWSAVVLGVVEGITEFLPVSSTGHLLIAEHWLGKRSDTFNIVIQSGAMLAVTLVYRKRLASLAASWRVPESRAYLGKLLGSFGVTAALGLVAKKVGLSLPDTLGPVGWALVLGGAWMLAAEQYAARQKPRKDVSWTVAIVVGIAQVAAGIFPGTSRSAATIFAAMLAGTTDRAAATEFAFLVGIPTMYAASAFELFGHFKSGAPSEDWQSLALAFVVSTGTAFAAVTWLLGYIRAHRYTAFAVYRLLVGGLLLMAGPLS